jgi:hypothetical protein
MINGQANRLNLQDNSLHCPNDAMIDTMPRSTIIDPATTGIISILSYWDYLLRR